ncbi:hypothetical protein EJ06DRAFT_554377 [Trichodelitschia bisporula]|uniref:Uncharacterized protein n=1 Tax=Trichodelitschia bisporula TaxID=703511 RepID=A0A6G1I3V2_9PEZI|nr:hypothetical protein EJ06DRAFT_554377 [Trichodelitschia bisporula]
MQPSRLTSPQSNASQAPLIIQGEDALRTTPAPTVPSTSSERQEPPSSVPTGPSSNPTATPAQNANTTAGRRAVDIPTTTMSESARPGSSVAYPTVEFAAGSMGSGGPTSRESGQTPSSVNSGRNVEVVIIPGGDLKDGEPRSSAHKGGYWP